MGVEAQEARQNQCSSCLLRKNGPFSDLRQGSAHPQPLCSKELPQFLRGCIQEHVRPQIQRRLLWAIMTRRGQSAAVESGKTAQFCSFSGAVLEKSEKVDGVWFCSLSGFWSESGQGSFFYRFCKMVSGSDIVQQTAGCVVGRCRPRSDTPCLAV